MKYKLTIAYDGTRYCGWQVQKNGLSIQSLIQKALETVLRHPVSLTGAGRTDAGVHARGQTAHFETEENVSRLLISLNALLPSDIRITRIDPVSSDFHARYSARSKIYHYHLHLDPILDPFARPYRHHVLGSLDLPRMHQALPHLIGTHDFTSFSNRKDTPMQDTIRTLSRLEIHTQKGGLRLEFEADGFLYKMVRNLTGTLLAVGKGKLEPGTIPTLFASRDRRKVPMAAPPQGLFLVEVRY